MSHLETDDPARSGEMTIRRHDGDPDPALRRLADLDGSSVPASPVLVAAVGGEPLAAISLADGAAIADPFRPTGGAVELLRLRAEQLRAHPTSSRWRRLLTRPGGRGSAGLADSPPGSDEVTSWAA
jgi:hypothetical protein